MELLFESRAEIARVEGRVGFFQVKPRVHREAVLVPDCPVDGAGVSIYGTVLADGGRLRMWYQAWPSDWNGRDTHLVGYAESDDGICWRKPILSLLDHAGDGGANNLCDLGFHSPAVFIDPGGSSNERYRATGYGGPDREVPVRLSRRGFYTAHSADGLHWTLDSAEPQWASGDVINTVYHPQQRRAIVALKHTPRVAGLPRRSIWMAERRDGVWSAEHAALLPDEYADISAIARGYASGDYYGMGMMPASSGTVGFLWNFRHALPRTAGTELGVFGAVDVSLVYQEHRGDCWVHRSGREDFIRHGAVPWASGGIYTASGVVDVGDEQRLYFTGARYTHGWYLDSRWQRLERRVAEMIEAGLGRIGFVSWPRDRLFGFRGDPEGFLELHLGEPVGPCELRLNLCTQAAGSVRVEIVDRPGFGLADAVPLVGDSLGAPATWGCGSTIRPVPGSQLKARIHLDCAEVYAFALCPATPSP